MCGNHQIIGSNHFTAFTQMSANIPVVFCSFSSPIKYTHMFYEGIKGDLHEFRFLGKLHAI